MHCQWRLESVACKTMSIIIIISDIAIIWVFPVPTDDCVKLKKSENKSEYLKLTRELGQPWNIGVTVISMVVGALGAVSNVLGLEIEKL